MLVFAVAAVKLHPGLGRGRPRLRPAHRTRRTTVALRVLRRRPARRGDDAVRGLLLLLGRRRGALGAEGSRAEQGERDDRLRARRLPLARVDDRRRHALSRQGGSQPEFLGTIALGAKSRSARSACCSRSSASSSRSAAPRSTRSSPAPTTWRSSSGGSGAATVIRRGAPRFTLTWLVLLVLALGVVMTGVDPVQLTEYAVIFSASRYR